jgi:formate-dependent nitrite reductase membrane component NrfD
VQAIIAGDMDDHGSEIAHLLAQQDVTVRKPEQGTSPKVFYINGNDVALHPTALERTPETFMWADVIPLHNGGTGSGEQGPAGPSGNGRQSKIENRKSKMSSSGALIRTPQPQGTPWNGPIQFGASMAEHMVQVAYNAQHKIPWHWPVPAYLVTKGIGAGIFMILSLGLGLKLFAFDSTVVTVAGFISLLFIAITTGLLVIDLEKPERFVTIMIRPQWESWLARGALILVGFTIVAGMWWLIEAAAHFEVLPADVAETVRPIALWLGLPLAIGAAVYTAYLFAQAEGRDLWQSPLLPVHLLIQSFMVGSAALLIVGLFVPEAPEELTEVIWIAFVVALILDLFVTLVGEFSIPHASEVAAMAAHDISHGRYKNYFWWGSITLGHVVPLGLAVLVALSTGQPVLGAIAGLCAIVGMYLFEYAFVMAPQDIPNS